MDRSAIFIDAGYLLAGGGRLCCGTKNRRQFKCDHKRLTGDFGMWAKEHSGGMPSLRTYWYDGAPNAVPTVEHELIAGLAYVKVRLGRIHSGQQKGVDALIYRDLMTLARERAIARAYLLSGDEDLREGVVAAQDMGVQVVLIGIPTSQRANQSAALVREADEHVVLPKEYWDGYFSRVEPEPEETAPDEVTATAVIESNGSPAREPDKDAPTPEMARAAGRAFAVEWAGRSTAKSLAELLKEAPRIPGQLDYDLITVAEKSLGSLKHAQPLKHELRAGFWAALDEAADVAKLASAP